MSKKYLLLFVPFLFITSCQEKYERTKPILEKITESVYASGSIQSKNQYEVFSTVNGLVQKILVEEGDMVEVGQAIMRIEGKTSKLNAENARLAVEFAESNKQGARLSELKGNIKTAKSKMLNDSLLWERQKGLWAQGIGSKVELEQRKLAFEAATNAYNAAKLRFSDLKKQFDFAAQQSQKLLSINKQIADDFTIRSQSKGRIYSLHKEVGEIVNPQTALAIIGDAESFIAELQIDENDIIELKVGQRVLLTLDSYRDSVFEANIRKINPIMNDRTRTFTVEADFDKNPPILYPNLTVEANIIIQTKDRAMTIPRRFLQNNGQVLIENKEFVDIEIGLKDYKKVEVLSGLDTSTILLKAAE